MNNKNLNKSLDKIFKLLDSKYTTRDFYFDEIQSLRDFINSKFFYTDDSIIIPSSVKAIEDGELAYNSEKEVKYIFAGSKAEWSLVDKGQSVLDIPCVYCLDGLYIQRL